MKGIELPINILIIVAVAVIVLIAVVAMFYPAFSTGSSTVSIDVAKSKACRAWIANNCATGWGTVGVINFDANKNSIVGTTLTDAVNCAAGGACDTIQSLCTNYLQITIVADCKKLCGC